MSAREQVAVLGAGVMGAGIARLFASRHDVAVYDPRPDAAARLAEAGSPSLTAASSVAAAVEGATLIIEAVNEDLDLKHRLYAEIEAVNADAVIASNTSTFVPSRLAEPLARPQRLLVAHFFNPADVVPLVELVPSPVTDPQAIARVHELLLELGKAPIRLEREVPGFIANRLQAAIVREAMSLVRDGVADAETVDRAVTAGLGPRWAAAGPIRVMDLGGLDVWTALADQLFPVLDAGTGAPAELRALRDAGRLGAKTGAGFYEHDETSDAEARERIRRRFDDR